MQRPGLLAAMTAPEGGVTEGVRADFDEIDATPL